MNVLSPSILSADCCCLGEQIELIKKGGAKDLHIDVMDGMFVPSISYGVWVVESLRKIRDIVFDVHLMIEEPIRYIEAFRDAGADILTVHVEACKDVKATLLKIRELGCKAGLSVKPGTPVEALKPYLEYIDMILIMSVEPGFGGQKYIKSATDKIREAKALVDSFGADIDIEVDGGINLDNVQMVLGAGANVIVAGSAVFKGDVLKNTESFMKLVNTKNDTRGEVV